MPRPNKAARNIQPRDTRSGRTESAAEQDPAAALAAAIARNSKAATPISAAPETDQGERTAPEVKPTMVEPTPEAPKAQTVKADPSRPCTCGCGGLTRGGRFLPGHDARLHGRVKRELEGRLDHSGLTTDELAAVEAFIANGHIPTASFAPQDHKAPAHSEAKNAAKKRERLHTRIATLQAELDAAKAELLALGEVADENTVQDDHAEIVAAMIAEGTADAE